MDNIIPDFVTKLLDIVPMERVVDKVKDCIAKYEEDPTNRENVARCLLEVGVFKAKLSVELGNSEETNEFLLKIIREDLANSSKTLFDEPKSNTNEEPIL